ncbi:hypothetical protein DB771_00495 [Burkholderia sp. AU29985]|nr:hypothetical protein EGY28_16300 [Burkholderia dolosa]PRE53921.1 hypothetical protein C6P87_06915 [Burkholderia sp. AU12872]PUA78826.1 hypothetical protein DB771_00495 [Burkholderia sp. AU29985]
MTRGAGGLSTLDDLHCAARPRACPRKRLCLRFAGRSRPFTDQRGTACLSNLLLPPFRFTN